MKFLEAIFAEIQWFFQRGKDGVADSDVWNFDYYLAKVICKGLRKLKKISHTTPPNLTYKEWNEVLDKITYTFETYQKVIDLDYVYPLEDEKYEELLKYWENFNKEYRDNVHVMTNEELKKYEEGFDLFRKHFYDLWD